MPEPPPSPSTPPSSRTPLSPRLTLDDLARLVAWVPLADEDRARDAVRAPWTDELLGYVPRCTAADVEAAVARGRRAGAAWAARPVEERTAVLRRVAALVRREQERLLDVVQLESGKARLSAFEEVTDVVLVADYYARTAAAALAAAPRRGLVPGLTRVREHRPPVGVVGIIAPWNYPLTLAVTDALPALVAGNAVVLKPAEQTPFTALLAARLLYAAGVPPDLFAVLPGAGPEIGPPLVDAVDYVSFTGSTQIGRAVAARAGERLVGASLELGGKNAALVLSDADLDRTADGIVRGAFASTGQMCVSIERVFVHRPLYAELLHRMAVRADRLRVGPGFEMDIDVGSLVSAEVLEKVEAHVEDARAQGARIAAGGRRLPHLGPLFYAPTVVADVTPGMRLAHEETFGPVVAVYPVDTDDEAVERANDTPYGLNASVWTRDGARGRSVARRLRAGTVNVNEAYAAAWASIDAPMGGMKASGLGRRHGVQGLLRFTESQTVAEQRLLPLAPLPGMPRTAFTRLAGTLIPWLNRRG